MKEEPKIVGAINICNEEKIIADFLHELSLLVDEIVLVDEGSTDNTIKIAKKFPKVKKVACLPVRQFRSEVKNRNLALKLAQERGASWVLIIDADEFFEDRMQKEIRNLVKKEGVGCYRFRKVTLWKSTSHFRVDSPKFYCFKEWALLRINPALEWGYEDLSKRQGRLKTWCLHLLGKTQLGYYMHGIKGKIVTRDDIVLIHYSHVDWDELISKQIRYIVRKALANPRADIFKIIKLHEENWSEKGLKLKPVPDEWKKNLTAYPGL